MFMLNLHVELENPTIETQVVVFEEGRCFEMPDPNSGLQNVVVSKTTEVVLHAREQQIAILPAFCLNREREIPNRHKAVITPFVLDQPVKSQNQLWELMELPAA